MIKGLHSIHIWETLKLSPETNAHNIKHRGSYMSAHGLLDLLNELGKRDIMGGLLSILSLFSQGV